MITAFALAPYYTSYIIAAMSKPQQSSSEVQAAIEDAANKTIVIEVEGMTCAGCEPHINETLKELKGVVSSEASYRNKNVKVIYNPNQVSVEQMKAAINEIGYKAK